MFHLKFACCLFSNLWCFKIFFLWGMEAGARGEQQPEKSTPNAVFVRHMKKCSLPPNQELNLHAALTLYLLCTIACKLHYYFQVPYHSFWAISVSTEMSCILILNFGAIVQPASARERITRGLRLNGIRFV